MGLIGAIIGDWATGVGLAAGLMAIGGFLAHTKPVFRRDEESEIRIATVMGGLGGLAIASVVWSPSSTFLRNLLSALGKTYQ